MTESFTKLFTTTITQIAIDCITSLLHQENYIVLVLNILRLHNL